MRIVSPWPAVSSRAVNEARLPVRGKIAVSRLPAGVARSATAE